MKKFALGFMLLLTLAVGCQKVAPLDYAKEAVLKAGGSETITLDAVNAIREVVVTAGSPHPFDGFLVIGDGKPVADKVASGMKPTEGTYHSILGGTGGTVTLLLPAGKEFNLVLRNNVPKENRVAVKIQAKAK